MYRSPIEIPEPEPHWLIRAYRYCAKLILIIYNYNAGIAG